MSPWIWLRARNPSRQPGSRSEGHFVSRSLDASAEFILSPVEGLSMKFT